MNANGLTSEEFLAKEQETWDAEQPTRDKIAARKNKVVEELISLGITKSSAELLVGIHRYDEDIIDL